MAFSPLAITGYTLLAIVTSYTLLRLYQYLKAHFLSTNPRGLLPQPVSAGRTSSLSLFPAFSLLRARSKSIKTVSTWGRWPPLPALLRRLTRPSSPLHLSGIELLPTSVSHSSPDNTHSLLDLPLMSGSFPVPVLKGQQPQHKRLLSRSSSMDALPSYRPLTPVPVLVPIPVRTIPLAPSAPPPPSPTPIPEIHNSGIALVPMTPQKSQYMPTTTLSSGGLPTPPFTGTFPTAFSPFKQGNATASPSSIIGSRSSSPSPSRVLSSHTISSLSLSPRSPSQQSRRSKSLGGVTVKKISPPLFNWDETEYTRDVADSNAEIGDGLLAPASIVSAIEQREHTGQPTSNGSSRFLLNISSLSSSLGSGLSPGSPSPMTSNSSSAPASAPLLTPRTISSSSAHSSDIAKLPEQVPLLPRPIPLVDVDTNIDADMIQHFGGISEKTTGWNLEVDEPQGVVTDVEHVLLDLEMATPIPPPAYMKPPLMDLCLDNAETRNRMLVDVEPAGVNVDVKQIEGERWEWDNDLEGQGGGWDMQEQTDIVSAHPSEAWDLDDAVLEHDLALSPPPSALVITPDIETQLETEAKSELVYPDPDLLPLPDALDVLPSSPRARVNDPPRITVHTQAAVLFAKDLDSESGVAYMPSKGVSTPELQAQTPTPPASPPRAARMSPLPKAGNGQDLGWGESSPSGLTGPSLLTEEGSAPADMEGRREVPIVIIIPAVDEEDFTTPEGSQSDLEQTAELGESEEDADDEEIVTVLDKGLVHSPTTIYKTFSETNSLSSHGSTYDTEVLAEQDESGVGYDVVPASASAEVPAWNYGYEGEDEEESLKSEEINVVEEAVEVVPDQDSQLKSVPRSMMLPVVLEPEVPSVPASAPGLKPNTSLPGTFPDSTQATKSQPQESSPPSQQVRQRKFTSLEKAIERTRSPLEVALAMQLRPGLGVGADPAWMVRFLMVMWGWMFGMVLVPSA